MRRYDHMADVEAFVATSEHGNLSRAAVALGTTPSMISRAIARLERRLGVQLMRRTTRRMSLTVAGQHYLERSQTAFALISEAEREIQGQDGPLVGTVRISTPTSYGHHRLPGRLRAFRTAHPGLAVELDIGNRNVDMVAEGFDLAIRGGELPDSRLVAHRLEDAAFCMVAAPDYLRGRGTPGDIASLAAHVCIAFVLPSTGRILPWRLRDAGRDVDWMPDASLRVAEDVLGLVSLARAGLGICHTYRFIVADDLRAGTLIEVLPDTGGRTRPFSLLYPPHRRLSAATRALIDALRAPIEA
jgi:DNA-binding transcriptional LysR family regulator